MELELKFCMLELSLIDQLPSLLSVVLNVQLKYPASSPDVWLFRGEHRDTVFIVGSISSEVAVTFSMTGSSDLMPEQSEVVLKRRSTCCETLNNWF